jgi:hypothetical protein
MFTAMSYLSFRPMKANKRGQKIAWRQLCTQFKVLSTSGTQTAKETRSQHLETMLLKLPCSCKARDNQRNVAERSDN